MVGLILRSLQCDPATNAVAIRAEPAHATSAGDLVQVRETDPLERVLTGELRGVAGDTVAIDAADTPRLNPTERYKLVTLPVENRPDREFASLLRAADETLATVTVELGSELDGAPVAAIEATVAAVTREDAQPEPLPERDRTLRAGDVVYAIATPEVLRGVETAVAGTGTTPTTGRRDSADSTPEADDVAAPDRRPDGDVATNVDAVVDGDGDGDEGTEEGGTAAVADVDGADDVSEDAVASSGEADEEHGEAASDDGRDPIEPHDGGDGDPLADPLAGDTASDGLDAPPGDRGATGESPGDDGRDEDGEDAETDDGSGTDGDGGGDDGPSRDA